MRCKSNEKERKGFNHQQHVIKHAISSVSESFMKQQVFLLTTISNLHFYLSPRLHAACFTLHAETISQPPKPESICHKAVVHSLPRLGAHHPVPAGSRLCSLLSRWWAVARATCAPCLLALGSTPGSDDSLNTAQNASCTGIDKQAFFMFGISCNEFSYLNHEYTRFAMTCKLWFMSSFSLLICSSGINDHNCAIPHQLHNFWLIWYQCHFYNGGWQQIS